MESKYRCPCCGFKTLAHKDSLYHEICPVCYWENDAVQNTDPTFSGGANKVSLNIAKENYLKYGAVDRELVRYVRSPFDSEK